MIYKIQKVLLVIVICAISVTLASQVISAPPGSDPTQGDISSILNTSNNPQSKGCIGGASSSLSNTTLSLCSGNPGSTTQFALRTEGLLSAGPIVASGPLVADMSQATQSLAQSSGLSVRDAVVLIPGYLSNIATIKLNKPRLGVWSDFLNTWAQGRFGRLDAEKVIITDPSLDNTNPGGTVDPYRTTSYTTSLGPVAHLDIAGTTNVGLGDTCYRKIRSCDLYSDNMYISGYGSLYTSCRDLDPSEFLKEVDKSTAGFTCEAQRDTPTYITGNMYFIPNSNGYTHTGTSTAGFCSGNSYGSIVNTSGSLDKELTMSTDQTFDFGTYIFVDPYLEKPVSDGWHAGPGTLIAQTNSSFSNGVEWFRTTSGVVTGIAYCSPSGIQYYQP